MKFSKRMREVFCWRGTVYYHNETSKDFRLEPLHDDGLLDPLDVRTLDLYGSVYEELHRQVIPL